MAPKPKKHDCFEGLFGLNEIVLLTKQPAKEVVEVRIEGISVSLRCGVLYQVREIHTGIGYPADASDVKARPAKEAAR